MKKKRTYLKKGRKIDIILIIVLIIIGILIIDFVDINERLGFPISVMDEPLMILFGFLLGYLVAKFRFFKIVKELK